MNLIRPPGRALLLIGLGLLWLLLVGACNARLYHLDRQQAMAPLPPGSLEQLSRLRGAIEAGADRQMQGLFPEGYVFTDVFYGLSWVQIGLAQESLRARALPEARFALDRIDAPAGKAPYTMQAPLPNGMFYRAWRAYLLGGILKLQASHGAELDPDERQDFIASCQQLADALEAAPHPYLPSYPRQTWPVDTYPAAVALKLHGELIDGRHDATLQRWLARLDRYDDPDTELPAHSFDAQTGKIRQGSRGSSSALILRLLLDIDPARAARDYTSFRKQFLVYRLGIPGIAEHPGGSLLDAGDIDSGPLIFGVSLSATAVGLGNARLYHDRELAWIFANCAEFFGFPSTTGEQKSYLFGELPVGELFLVWSKTARPITNAVAPRPGFSTDEHTVWRWSLHLLSLLPGLLLLLLGLRSIKKGTRALLEAPNA